MRFFMVVVFRINTGTGAVAEIASGFLGAVDVAVAPDGTIYVAELFANRISKVVGNGAQAVADIASPGAIEWSAGMLYATTDVFGNGAIVTVTP